MKLNYILKRIMIIIPTFFGITILTYFLSVLAPGSPLDSMLLSETATVSLEDIARLEARYGLDKPIIVQYFTWLGQLLRGNFGVSYRTSEKVLDMILARLVPTLAITVTTMVIAVILAIIIGVIAAMRPYSIVDYLASGLSFLTLSTPGFFLALVLVYVFSVRLGVTPVSGMYTTTSGASLQDLIWHMILPVSVLVCQHLGNLIRQVRGSMLEVLQEDYVRTARGKGLREKWVIIRHGLRNALIPLITTIGLSIPFLIGGTVVTEQIFSWPGLGTLMIQSVNARDYPCIMGITVFVAIVVLFGNLIIDLAYGLADPRISYQKAVGGKAK